MDKQTARYYENHAPELMELYNSVESPLQTLAPLLFKQEAKVLDVGSGSGRDITLLLELGYNAYGLEPSDSLIELAIQQNPDLADRIFKGALPDLLIHQLYFSHFQPTVRLIPSLYRTLNGVLYRHSNLAPLTQNTKHCDNSFQASPDPAHCEPL